MSEKPPEVIINGVRYIPAREVAAGIADIRSALLDVYWGENYRGGYDAERAEAGIFIAVHDDAELGGESLTKFMDDLAAKLPSRS